MKKLLAPIFLLLATPSWAQNPQCPTRPNGDSTNACASTAFVQNTVTTNFANPTAQIGLTAVNGAATTAMRSDAAPALSQAIAPTWTGIHIWADGASRGVSVNPNNVAPTQSSGTDLNIGSLHSSYGWIQSFNSLSLDLNPLGNAVNVGGVSGGNGIFNVAGNAITVGAITVPAPFQVTATYSGTQVNPWTGSGSALPVDAGGAAIAYPGALINITADTLNAGGAYVNALTVNMASGGTAMQGGRQAFASRFTLTAPSNGSNANYNYVGGIFSATALTGDNGTNTGAGARGSIFGFGAVSSAENGALNLDNVTGGEVNVAVKTGASARYKAGLQVAALPGDAVQGSVYDTVLSLSAQAGGVGANDAILVCNCNGLFPLRTNGNILRSIGGTFANGIDLTSSTISTAAFKSPGFVVDGAGVLNSGAVGGGSVGTVNLLGTTSGTVAIKVQAAAGTYNFNIPITVGTAGQVLTSQGGGSTAMTWTSAATGTVTSIATTSPITGGTITTTGTIACATCVTSAAALTANSLMIGAGSQASSVTTTGTGVLTALGVNVGSAGAFVTFNGALGTPSSGTVTNLTGTASININGTVGATTPTTVAFTTASGNAININASIADTYMLNIVGSGVSAGHSDGVQVVAGTNNLDLNFSLVAQNATTVLFRVWGDGGVTVGAAPTGSTKGAGTINVAGDIYKNNTAYTNPDYVFEHFYRGRIERFAESPGAGQYEGLMSYAQLRAYTRAHLRLPGISDKAVGIFERGDFALRYVEDNTLRILDLNERLIALESRITR